MCVCVCVVYVCVCKVLKLKSCPGYDTKLQFSGEAPVPEFWIPFGCHYFRVYYFIRGWEKSGIYVCFSVNRMKKTKTTKNKTKKKKREQLQLEFKLSRKILFFVPITLTPPVFVCGLWVCEWWYIYMCVCVCICICVYVCVHICVHMCIYVCLCAHYYFSFSHPISLSLSLSLSL